MDANKLWTSAKQRLKGIVHKSTYELYYEDNKTKPIAIDNNIFYLSGIERTKQFFENQGKEKLLEVFGELAANITDIIVITDEDTKNQLMDKSNISDETPIENTDRIKILAKSVSNANLNPKYTFDTFVIGPSNNFAVAACQNVARYNDTFRSYNPLFLYGGVGLGKTHLMHAIGHEILESDPLKKVLYVSSETFTNELIQAIRENKNEEFRRKYRSVDVLMVDDVQFLSGKASVQEELFHTFNDLHALEKKIILSSDKHPQDIQDLELRLKSRFRMGIATDIQPPDYSTRMAILQTKAETENIEMPKEVIEYIADNVQSNIRELEGALNKVILYSRFTSKELGLETAKEALKDILVSYSTKAPNILRIKEMVAESYNVTVEELDSKKRTKNIAYPRQVAMYLSRHILNISLPSIGEQFGGRDHTTVIHSINKIEDEIEKNEVTKMKIEKIISDLK
ncbi:chromosomal replication initiator protein DnaA [Peptostreptococcus equinus]|uniref:Chromosomal replication initiator protein DnaA n=1 Tax=Peptostreptococcus equinus TaxID=3003601 RepID=A0ABY7JRX5_9FIRM|nr:chromosomal replication initiator protein DnaA [Peptostreptococcus sp. CBA3647]WAW14918.1 chromosomal replication initiator protein DnaA [Peptostreptococcus sp. CBA3647]